MRVKITIEGPPASGKSTARRLIEAAIRQRFEVDLQSGLGMTSDNEHYIELECKLKEGTS